ncbi:MAG: MFS transporter [Aeromicrobium erythreum]
MPAPSDPAALRARRGTLLAFATNGALVGSLLPRYPEVARALDLSTAQLGLVVVAFGLGASVAGSMPGWWLRRFGSRRVSAGSTWLIAALLAGAGLATTTGPSGLPWFVALMFLAGVGDAVADVSQNSQGLRVQQAYGRSVLSTMHAGWSAGAALGGAAGALAARLDVPLPAHLAVSGTLCAILVTLASTTFLPDRDPRPEVDEHGVSTQPSLGRALVLVLPLTLIALGGFAVEDVGNNWSAYFLRTELGLSVGLAGLGVTTVLGAQFVGRLLGDRVIDRLGPRTAVRLSLLAVAAGMVVAAWAPWEPLTFAGFAVAGAGCAISVPVAFAEADRLPGLAPHQGLALSSWLMRATTLAVSPLVGLVGQEAGLRQALTVIAAVGLAGLLFTGRLRAR